ncbi:hypothetical protein NQ318_022438 [Aromia moschata]|uniref:DUF3668 domain-containing protein n=1 Tax=Aromia moschata TaxID=1265417 RepID=A0AAV8Z6Y9_9CUCU|nr:hypothetical protein NQ318_022438 [Aromia moschata]
MNQLSGKYVNVVLSVERGRGMEFLKNSVHISGNFNSRILEQIVNWSTRKDLRKIRSANQPLRVECVSTDAYNRKERVGFALLSLRSAHIIPVKNANQDVTFKWHKLIGCQTNKKKFTPEVYMSLTVRDHLLNEAEASSSIEAMPYISEEDTNIGEEILSSKFPITYLEDGYIQIGEDDVAQNTFTLNLFVKEAVNLDSLLPEILVFQQNKEKCFLSFKILGVTIKTKPFRKELHNAIALNEKIVVKLLSDQDVLEEFFKTQNVTINFFCGQDKIGTTNIDLNEIFTLKELKCYFKYPSPNGIIPFMDSEKSPFIEVHSWLEQDEKEMLDTREEEKPKPKIIFSDALKQPDCSGDQVVGSYVLDKLEKINIKSVSDSETHNHEEDLKPVITKSVDTVIKNIPLTPRLHNPLDTYQRYVLDVSLTYLLWKKPPKDTKIIFKFLHPKAASYITIFTEVENSLGEHFALTNLKVKITYVSTSEKVKNLLNAWPPKLVLMDEKERSLSEEYEFSIVLLKNLSVDQDITVKAARTLEPLAKLGVSLTLNESSLDDAEEKSNLMLLPAVLDEVISVKEISDIGRWKEMEKGRFEEELEKVKAREVKKLQDEWQRKKDTLEEQLNKNIDRCRRLQEQLQNKANMLQTEKYLISRRSGSNLYEDIFKENWKNYHEDNTKEVIELLSRTQRDNEHLREKTSNLLEELRILEEKFEEAQNAKSYFKEQWRVAYEEIHQMKTDDIINIQNQLQQNREQLSQLSLDKFANFRQNGDYPDIYNPDSGRRWFANEHPRLSQPRDFRTDPYSAWECIFTALRAWGCLAIKDNLDPLICVRPPEHLRTSGYYSYFCLKYGY